MKAFIPQFISDNYLQNKYSGNFSAFVMQVDINGFTSLTQILLRHGQESLETLTATINKIYTPAFSAIEEEGGFISGFAGDAFTAVFPSRSISYLNVFSAAKKIQDFFDKFGLIILSAQENRLKVRIGIGFGAINWKIIKTNLQSVYWFYGPALQKAVLCQKSAQENEIIFHREIFNIRKLRRVGCRKAANDFCALEHFDELPEKCKNSTPNHLYQKDFLPFEIGDLGTVGEFREVVSCFINLAKPLKKQIIAIIEHCNHYGGYFNKIDYADKGFVALVVFGAPVSQEKIGERVLSFAGELQKICGKNMRIGLSYEQAYAGMIGSEKRAEYTVIGMAVNLGARYMGHAAWGEIWCDRYLQKERNHTFRKIGDFLFKGFAEKIPAYLFHVKNAEQALQGKNFVGRSYEMEFLQKSYKKIGGNTFAGITYVYGDAGQGKSHLLERLRSQNTEDIQFITLQCDAVSKQTLGHFVTFIRANFTSISSGGKEKRRIDFRKHWAAFVNSFNNETVKTDLIRIESVIAGIIGLEWENSFYANLSSAEKPLMVILSLKTLFACYALQKPLLLIIEDLQWADAFILENFAAIIRQLTEFPLKIIVTSRFKDNGTKPQLPLKGQAESDEITLAGLTLSETEALIDNLLPTRCDEKLLQYIYRQSQGNPFYSEQIALYLWENNKLEANRGRLSFKPEQLRLPPNVQSLLVARLDRLSDTLKPVVQIASVLGSEFAQDVLAKVYEELTDNSEENFLEVLKEGKKEHLWQEIGDNIYRFRHALLQEAAYNMQLKRNLRRVHRVAGINLEKLYQDDKPHFKEIAWHYDSAGDWKNATVFYSKAGYYEEELFNLDAAEELYTHALKLHEKHEKNSLATALSYSMLGNIYGEKGLFDKSFELQFKALHMRREILNEEDDKIAESYQLLGNLHLMTGAYQEALDYYQKTLTIRKNIFGENHPDTATCYLNIGIAYTYLGDFQNALAYYEKELPITVNALGENHQDTSVSYFNIGTVHWYMEDNEKALRFYQKSLSIREKFWGEKHPAVANVYQGIGNIYLTEGTFDEALRYYEKSLLIRQELFGDNHPQTAAGYINLGIVWANKKDYQQALDYYEKALAIQKITLGEEHPEAAISLNNIGDLLAQRGETEKALTYFHKAYTLFCNSLGEQHPNTQSVIQNLAESYEKCGDSQKAAHYFGLLSAD